jgi:molybdopterin-guanine dinucleotide biosynthesis protein A
MLMETSRASSDARSISAIILAGGEGKRLRNPVKAKISVGGKPVIDGILDTIDGIFSEIIIASNNPDEFSGYETCSVVTDIYKGAGPLGGIHAAMTFSDSEAFFVLAGDMLFLTGTDITHDRLFY